MKKIILLFSLLPCCLNNSFSQSGQPDPSFGGTGIVKTEIGSGYNYEFIGKQMLLQADGSIYVILQSQGQTLIAKKYANGSSNVSYGEKGFSVLSAITPIAAALQPDGKIVVAGQKWNGINNEFDLVRYNINGSLDNAFGNNGIKHLDHDIVSIAIQGDGKMVILASGQDNDNSYFEVHRYNVNGIADSSFSVNGRAVTNFGFSPGEGYTEYDNASAVAIQGDGKIVVIGSAYNYSNESVEMAIARYKTDGSLDNTFDHDGKLTTNFGSLENYGYSIAFQSDGKIIAAGYTSVNGSDYNFAIARYNINGSLDNTFSGDGKQTQNVGASGHNANMVAIQNDGKIVVGGDTWNGSNNDFVVARFNTNGSVDNTFATNGNVKTDFGSSDDYANSLAIQSDGKILVEGYAYTYTSADTRSAFVMARYNTNGSLDNTFDGDGKLKGVMKQGYTVYNSTVVQPDGKVVAAGYAWNGSNNDFALARYNTDGSLDSTFSSDGKLTTNFGADEYGNSVVIQSDGKIVVAGYTISTNSYFAVARYNTDGSLDNTFSSDGKLTTSFGSSDNFANAVAVQSDGKIIAAGYTRTADGSNTDIAVARYNANGSLDNTFSGDGKQTTDINFSDDFGNSIAIQNDGKIVVAGRTWNGNDNDFAIVRYNTNGTPDNTFDNDGKQTTDFGFSDDYATSVAIQSDGKIVAGGYNGNYSTYKIAVARYNTDGKPDPSFSGDGMQVSDFGLSDASANSIVIESDGKIICGGSSNHHFAIARFNSDGSNDNSFFNNGIQITAASSAEDKIQSIAIKNNKLYAVGYGTYPATLGVITRYSLDENKLPSVSITSPANNTVYTAPATITINATASDADGSISSVKFYNGQTYLKTDFTSPYSYTLSNLPAGTYVLTAKATDNKGAQTISAPVKVIVNKAPIVSITSPTNSTSYAAPATITIKATASDADGSITSVKFYNGSTYLKTVFSAPYSYTLSNLPAGTYSLTAKATDNLGAQTISAPVTVTVSNTSIVLSRPLENDRTDADGIVSFKLSPNPTSKTLNIYTSGLVQNKESTISILSVSGVTMQTVHSVGIAKVIQLDVSSLTNGVYIIKIVNGDKILYKQFVKM